MSDTETLTLADIDVAPLLAGRESSHLHGLPEAEGVDILIHVGLHKTGTSWLQENIFGAAEDTVYRADFRPTHRAFLLPPADSFSLDIVREEFGPSLLRARTEGKPLVISDEALAGRAYQQKFYREVAALRIRSAFPQARILVTVREQRALLTSLHSEYLRSGYSSSLERFLAQETGNPNIAPPVDFGFYEYDRLQRMYEDLFGPRRVAVVPMEWMLSHPEAFMARLSALVGHTVNLPAAASVGRKVRPQLSSWALAVQRIMNGFVAQDSRTMARGGRLSPNSMAHRVDRLTPSIARQRGSASRRKIVDRLVGDRFAASNERFAQMSGYDLAALGYPVDASGASKTQTKKEVTA